MEKVIDRRQMRGDDGNIYDVVEIQQFISVDTKDGRDYIPQWKRLELVDGRDVIMLNNRFTIRGTDIHLSEIG